MKKEEIMMLIMMCHLVMVERMNHQILHHGHERIILEGIKKMATLNAGGVGGIYRHE